MLLETKIKDFQSLSDVTFFHGGLTVLIGDSDVGKSSVVRAIRLLHRNAGTSSFVRHGKTKLSVEQTFDDGSIVSIEKGKSLNTYVVNGNILSKIGREVPDSVLEVLNSSVLTLDKDLTCDLNFSSQFDSPFLITESSTFITKAVSVLSGIEIIYSAIREGASQAQKLKATAQVLAGNVVNLEKYEGLMESAGLLSAISNALQSEQEAIEKASQSIEKLALLRQKSVLLGAKVVDVVQEEKNLSILTEAYKSMLIQKKSIETLEVLQNKVNKVKPASSTEEIDEVNNILQKLGIIFSVVKTEQKSYTELWNKAESLKKLEAALTPNELQSEALWAEEQQLKASIKICDKCGNPI